MEMVLALAGGVTTHRNSGSCLVFRGSDSSGGWDGGGFVAAVPKVFGE